MLILNTDLANKTICRHTMNISFAKVALQVASALALSAGGLEAVAQVEPFPVKPIKMVKEQGIDLAEVRSRIAQTLAENALGRRKSLPMLALFCAAPNGNFHGIDLIRLQCECMQKIRFPR